MLGIGLIQHHPCRIVASVTAERERLLGRKTLEVEVLKEALAAVRGKKPAWHLPSPLRDGSRCDTLGVVQSNLVEQIKDKGEGRGGYQRQGLAGIGQVVAALGEGQEAHVAQQQGMREAQRLKGVQRNGARDASREQLGRRQGPRMGM